MIILKLYCVKNVLFFNVFLHLLLSNNGEVFNACRLDSSVEDSMFYIGILLQYSTHPPTVKTESH